MSMVAGFASGTAWSSPSDTTWLRPVSGPFADASRWSNGVPGTSDTAIFGPAHASEPYVVTATPGFFVGGLSLSNQRLIVLLAGEGTHLGQVVGPCSIGGEVPTSLTFSGGAIQLSGPAIVGDADEIGELRLATGTLWATGLHIGMDGGAGVVTFEPGTSVFLLGGGTADEPNLLVGTAGAGHMEMVSVGVACEPGVWTIGADGGTASLTSRDVAHVLRGTIRLGGDGSGRRAGGYGIWSVEDSSQSAGDLNLIVGSEGFGALQYAGANTFAGSIRVGDDGGVGVLSVVGSTSLGGGVSMGSHGGRGTVIASGVGTEFQMQNVACGLHGNSTFLVHNHALVDVDNLTLHGFGGTASVRIEGGGVLRGDALTIGGTPVVPDGEPPPALGPSDVRFEVTGAESMATFASLTRLPLPAGGTWSCVVRDGALMVVPAMKLSGEPGASIVVEEGGALNINALAGYESSTSARYDMDLAREAALYSGFWRSGAGSVIRLRHDAEDAPLLDVDHAQLRGRLEVVWEDDTVPDAGAIIPVIETSIDFADEFDSFTLPAWHGYPPLVRSDGKNLRLEVIDHVDALVAPPEAEVWIGMRRAVTVVANVDGEAIDVTRQVTWEFDETYATKVGIGEFMGLQGGVIPVTARFGKAFATISLTVRDDIASIPFTLVNTVDGTWVSGASPGSYLEQRGSSLSFDGSVVTFSTATAALCGAGQDLPGILVRDIAGGALSLLNPDPQATPNDVAGWPSVSRNGRFVAFGSSTALVPLRRPGGTAVTAIYLHDRESGGLDIASVALDGGPPDKECLWPEVSEDGRYVFFSSSASNLVPNDLPGSTDVFRRDRWKGITLRVNSDVHGTPLGGGLTMEAISPDGRYAYVRSSYTGVWAGYRKDCETGALAAVTPDWLNAIPGGAVTRFDTSADGRFIALVATIDPSSSDGLTGATDQLYLVDTQTGVSTALSTAADGQWFNADVTELAIDDAGRFVVFLSKATNAFPESVFQPGYARAFRYDRHTGVMDLLSVGVAGPFDSSVSSIDISGDGSSILMGTSASNVLPFDSLSTPDLFLLAATIPDPADLNGDGAVNAADLANLLGSWGPCEEGEPADLDHDASIGATDLGILLSHWSVEIPCPGGRCRGKP